MPTASVSAESAPSIEHLATNLPSLERRNRKRIPPFIRSLAFLAVVILLVSNGSGLARAGNSPPGNGSDNGLQVNNLQGAVCLNPTCTSLSSNPGHAVVGQKLLFTGAIQGGIANNVQTCQASGNVDPTPSGYANPCLHGVPGTVLYNPGYHIYWFFGEVNSSQNATNTTAPISSFLPPSSCLVQPGTSSSVTPTQCPSSIQTSFGMVHTFNRTGTFDVSTTVYDANFDWVITTTLITVVAPSFSVSIQSAVDTSTPNGTAIGTLEEGLPVSFTSSCGPSTAACANTQPVWNFGDGGIGYGWTPTHIYALRGNYVATLTASDVTSGAMNRSFISLNVSNIGAFKSVGQTVGSLLGPYPFVYSPPAGYGSSVPVNRPPVVVKAGVSLNFCSWAYDFSSVDSQNLTFQWHFSNTSNPYTIGRPLALAPRIAAAQCEPQPYGYYSSQLLVLQPEFTTVAHTFVCPGWYNVTVSVIDPQGIRVSTPPSQMQGGAWVRNTIEIHAVNITAPPQSQIPKYQVPVGQVALLNASNTLGIPPTSAFYNYTWNAGRLGTTWGDVGRDSSFRVVNQKVAMTTQVNSTAIPCCNPNPVNVATWTNFTDVRPTVGIDSFYTTASMTVTVQNPYYYDYLNFTLLENGQNQGWYNLSYPSSSVSFYPINLQMSDNWAIQLKYTPYGHSGGTYVNVAFNWANDNTYIDNYDYTESPDASDTASVWFSNANTTRQNTVPINVNAEALGEPFTTYVVFFSPAQTNLTETWTMGDGTVYHTSDSAPSSPGPTLSTWYLQYAYYTGANYIFNVSACDDYHYCSGDQIAVSNTNTFAVNDTAPFVSLHNSAGYSPESLPGVQNTFKTTVTNQDNTTGSAMVNWQYGDGLTSMNFTRNTAGGIVYGVHSYRYSWSKYLVVVFATSKNGSTSANYTLINVADPPPIASFTSTPSSPVVGAPVTFNGATSEAGLLGALGLSFGWQFGDGNFAGGQGTPAEIATNNYAATGTYTARLTVENDEGGYAYATQAVTVTSPPVSPPFPWVTNQTNVTADVSGWYNLHVPSGSNFANVPILNATWFWGDGSYATYGRSTVHTFLFPGNYNVSVAVTAQYMGVYWAHSLVHVQDGVPTVAFVSPVSESYGEIHVSNITAIALGDYADQWKPWHFTWAWGDGSSWYNTTGTLTDSVTHTYTLSGALTLNVNISGPYGNHVYPWSKLGAPNASGVSPVLSMPNVDGDGLPDAYAAAVNGASISSPGPNVPSGQEWGSLPNEACTWYVGASCAQLPGIGSFSGDITGCGLTNIQQIMGSVTGFYSDPLQCNQAGDNITNAKHIFTSQYTASQEVFYNSGTNYSIQTIATLPIPNVAYGGPAIAFNQSKLSIQLNTTSLGPVSVYVFAPGLGWTLLGTPTSAVSSFVLVQSSPVTGSQSQFGISVSDFLPGGPWAVGVDVPSGSSSGSIKSATITVSYYTNPAVADPTHQGMVEGNDVSVPIFNCSEPTSAAFSQFNPASYTVSQVNYYPYTLQYYKLSVAQGLPYVPGHWSYWGSINNGTAGCPVAGQLWAADTATYLGDTEFGIPAWNAHAAGDPALTNGMKALGARTYMGTRGQYVTAAGQVMTLSGYAGYASDPLAGSGNPNALGPLNPTALSTAGDGIPDSQAIDPVHAIGLEVTITSAQDPYCYLLSGALYAPQDIAQVTLQTASGQNEPTIYTPALFPSSIPSANCDGIPYGLGTLYLGTQGFSFNFAASYFFPIADTAGSYTFNFALWQNETLTASPPRQSGQSTISITPACNVGCASTTLPGGFTGSVAVVALNRAPVVLMNITGEVLLIPGYGYRYLGEPRFYTFDFNLGSGGGIPAPFSSGTNILLESRQDVLNSSANATMLNNPASMANLAGCAPLGTAMVTSDTSSSTAIASAQSIQLTVSGDLSSSPSCLNPSSTNSLFHALIPSEARGIHGGEYVVLNTLQFELLGLLPNAVLLSPWIVPAGFNSPSGTPPVNVVSQVTTFVENALNAIAGAILALANFIGNLPNLVQAFGQAIDGAINAAVSAVETAAKWIVQAAEWLFNFVVGIFVAIFNFVAAQVLNLARTIASSVALPFLSEIYDMNLLSLTDFQNAYLAATDPCPCPELPAPEPLLALPAPEDAVDGAAEGVAGAVQTGDTAANVAADVATAGATEPEAAAANEVAGPGLLNSAETATNVFKTAGSVLSGWALTQEILGDFLGNNAPSIVNDLQASPLKMSANAAKEIGDVLSVIISSAWMVRMAQDFRGFFTAFQGLKLALIGMVLDALAFVPNMPIIASFVLAFMAFIVSWMGLSESKGQEAALEGFVDQVPLFSTIANAADLAGGGAEIVWDGGKLVCGGLIQC